MKACVIQPPYSMDYSKCEEYFQYKLDYLAQCDESLDLIVLPEDSDVPCCGMTREENLSAHHKYCPVLLEACKETAKRCNAVVFVNALYEAETGYRNTTYAIDRNGEIVGKYFKKHLPPIELNIGLDQDYTREFSEPYTITIDGVKYAFLTCYDFYFYEAFPTIARQNVDVIIGCSLQRSDTHEALEIMGRFLAYNCNAHLVRASVSLGEDSKICGCSMIVKPTGEMLLNMKSKTGLGVAEFDPKDKYYKPAGFGNPPAAHYEYIEIGRNPWQYRPGGSAIVRNDALMPYPRVCAHRGFNTIAPENSLPAFGAAVAMGAEEIEFDIWNTSDGVLVSCHDSTLDRVSDGHGKIYEHTYAELLELVFGAKHGEKFRGLKIPTFEEILQSFAGRVIMNIHVKIWDNNFPDPMIEQIVGLIRKYDAQKHAYFMTANDEIIRQVMEYAPDIPCCVGWDRNKDPMSMVNRAIELGAYKVQLYKPYFNEETVKKAHEHDILCNVFWSDDPEETKKFREMGIDTILTNDYNLVSQAIPRRK